MVGSNSTSWTEAHVYRPNFQEHSLSQIRSFSRVMTVFFFLLAGISAWQHGIGGASAQFWLAGIAVGWLLVGLVAPWVLRPLYHVWMWLAFVLNFVMSRVVLSVLFFVVLLPFAIVARLARKGPFDPTPRASYWKRHIKQAPKQHFERLFTMSELDDGTSNPVAAPRELTPPEQTL